MARAWKQLGSSGSGNHFVEFGIVEIDETDDVLNVPAENMLACYRIVVPVDWVQTLPIIIQNLP